MMLKKPPPELTVRALALGAAGAVVISASSAYVALRLGALPWPTVFVAVVSLAVLGPFGASLREINVAHTGMSAGGLVAGGLAFTIPAFWMADVPTELPLVSAIAAGVAGAVLGAGFTGVIRKYFIEERALPFPMGTAAAESLIAGREGGRKGRILFSACLASGIFTWLRDGAGLVPQFLGTGRFPSFWLSPMALGIGYIIGPLYMGTWLLGTLLANLLIIPLGLNWEFFPSREMAGAFTTSLGIGTIIGAGLLVLLRAVSPALKGAARAAGGQVKWLAVAAAIALAVMTAILGFPLLVSLFLILSVWFCVVTAATLTGQTGIDPMEIFGILVILAVRVFFHVGLHQIFLIAAVVAVATGLAGDALQDFKVGNRLGTSPGAQWVSESLGGIVGAVTAAFAIFMLHDAFGPMGPGTDFPAPQAFAVKSMIQGLPDATGFWTGFFAGLVLAAFRVPATTIGIGIYLPPFISLAAAVGGAAAYFTRKGEHQRALTLTASGFLGGEGITGVLMAIWKVVTLG